MKILIIEDEQHTANDLASSIEKVEPGSEVVSILKSVKESVAWFEKNKLKLDLIFSDIQLGDGLSFEIFKQVEIHTPVVFCTAYDEYALNAFKVNSIHYMLKPFNSRTVGEALGKFRDLRNTMSPEAPSYEAILDLLSERKRTTSVLIYQGDRIVPVKLGDIALSFIRDEVTHILTFDQKEYRLNKSLEEMEKLSGADFFRANRQFLVNRRAIKDSSQYFSRKLVVNLNVAFYEKITISKIRVSEYLNWLAEG